MTKLIKTGLSCRSADNYATLKWRHCTILHVFVKQASVLCNSNIYYYWMMHTSLLLINTWYTILILEPIFNVDRKVSQIPIVLWHYITFCFHYTQYISLVTRWWPNLQPSLIFVIQFQMRYWKSCLFSIGWHIDHLEMQLLFDEMRQKTEMKKVLPRSEQIRWLQMFFLDQYPGSQGNPVHWRYLRC